MSDITLNGSFPRGDMLENYVHLASLAYLRKRLEDLYSEVDLATQTVRVYDDLGEFDHVYRFGVDDNGRVRIWDEEGGESAPDELEEVAES